MPAYVIQKESIPRFLLKYCYIGIRAEMQVKQASKRQDTNPSIRASYQLLHERMKDERQHQW